MPLAGSMKLRTFLVIAGIGVLVVGGGAIAGTLALGSWGVQAAREAAEEAEAERAMKQARLEQDRARVAEERAKLEAERQRRMAEQREAALAAGADGAVGADGAPVEAAAVDLPNERPVDGIVAGYLGKPLGSDKRKDVTKGRPFKVNVYQDAEFAFANRAKVDLDRDDKWDEKWTWSEGVISRKTATKDDENYDVEQIWQQGAWR